MSSATRKMRILLSAYACEPGKGSEPEVGWSWAIVLARLGHEVWVITRSNNRRNIEQADLLQELPNLHFVYFDLGRLSLALKRLLGTNFYYGLWQRKALAVARELHREVGFDHGHHVTFVSARHPSFLRDLGIPFTFGPVAGGENIPPGLMASLPARGKVQEQVRQMLTRFIMKSPAVHATLAAASEIYVTSRQTLALLPLEYQQKAKISLAITAPPGAQQVSQRGNERVSCTRFLFVGRLISFKGLHLALRALASAVANGANVHFSIVGDGPEREVFEQLTSNLLLEERVSWVPWLPRSELDAIYARHDVLLFPSLRDSGGMVVLEAMQHGMPVICLALGGPGEIVDENSGFSVLADNEEAVIEKLAQAICTCANNPDLLDRLSQGARHRVADFAIEKHAPLQMYR